MTQHTKLYELFDLDLFSQMCGEGMVRTQFHPDFPELVIANYTEAAQFSRTWNDVTRVCRGLIFNNDTLEVLARPFQKIHNWDENEAPRITWEAPLFHWSNKEDGSLGIIYPRPDGVLAVATRGSFASDQAIHATALLHEHKGGGVGYDQYMEAGYTPLVEIIYPENRIVLDYSDYDDIVDLGFIHIPTGAYVPPSGTFTRTFADLIQDLSRPNSEGWVAWLDPYKAVKVKQADYVELHRIVTGLNEKSVWRAIRDGVFEEMLEQLPDELFEWAKNVAQELHDTAENLYTRASEYFTKAGGYEGSQKQFALNVQEQVPRHVQGLVFSLRSGKDIKTAIWKNLEPSGKRE